MSFVSFQLASALGLPRQVKRQTKAKRLKKVKHLKKALLLALLLATGPAFAQKAPSFEIRLGADGETIGEAQPVFIEIDRGSMPAISVEEVARRYRELLDTATDPSVRIDALHRLIKLQAVAGNLLDIPPEEELALYRQALDSYQSIIDSGTYEGPIDELLYQNARAYAFLGEEERSIDRLERLLDRYPDSDYALEARFRIAEHSFSLGDYAAAEAAYREVLIKDTENRFADIAQYMLGWSEFKRDAHQRAARHFLAVLDRYAEREGGLESLDPVDASMANDTFRVLSIIAAYQGGADLFERLLEDRANPSYEYLLYDRLADYYLVNERYTDSAAASEAFVEKNPAHPAAPALARQAVDAFVSGGFAERAMAAREAYIDRFGDDARVEVITAADKQTLLGYLDRVGRHYYRLGQQTSQGTLSLSGEAGGSVEGPSIGSRSREYYALAGTYLERWSQLLENGQRGEQLVLAADAWVRAGNLGNALPLYEIAAYREGNYDEAEDAGYAAVLIHRRQLTESDDPAEALAELVAASKRYISVHAEDPRAAAIRAYTANLLFERGLDAQADAMARPLTHDGNVTAEQRRAGLLIVANAAYNDQQFDAAERYYREALETFAEASALQIQTREKLTAAIYRQAEIAAGAGQTELAVSNFQRVAEMNESAPVAMNARFDAASAYLSAKDWDGAIRSLIDFKERYPDTELYETADDKLIHAYQMAGDFGKAADTLLAQVDRRDLTAAEVWEGRISAAEWYEKAARDASARAVYQDYLARGTGAFGSHEYQQELRWKLAEHANSEGDTNAAAEYYQAIAAAEQQSETDSRTARSRYLTAQSLLVLAGRSGDVFRQIQLIHPLPQALQRKQEVLEVAIAQYERAQQSGIAEVISQANFAIAELYRTLAKDLIESEPPNELTELQREQYTLLLEEQAYPFEEEAIALHERNQAMIAERHWNPWIDRSLEALAQLFPARYAREARWLEWSSEEVIQ